jgi:tetratricopeptide (TPR) repeat protein
MLANKPLLALREYRFVTEKDSSNLSAWQGMLWAYNALKKWNLTIKTSRIPLKLFPADPTLSNFTAYAYWNAYDALAAHKYYQKGKKQAVADGELKAQSTALEGLGWIYQSFDDYSLAYNSFQKAQSLSSDSLLSYGMDTLQKLNLNTSLSYSNLENKKSALAANQTINYKRLYINTGFEQFKIEGKRFRDAWSGGIGFQTTPFQLGVSGWYMDADTDIYPAHIYQGYLTEKYWLSDMMLQPTYRFAYSTYPEFNTYQNDLAISTTIRRTTVSAGIVHTQRDVDSPGADETWLAFHAKLSYAFDKGFIASLSAGKGRQDWWVSPVGYIVDTSITNTKYVGNTVLVPLSKSVNLVFYHQLGFKCAIWHYTGSLALNVSY